MFTGIYLTMMDVIPSRSFLISAIVGRKKISPSRGAFLLSVYPTYFLHIINRFTLL